MADDEFSDAIELLENDHREVEDLFDEFEDASGKEEKEQIARQICTELKIHSMIEEEIFYPALRGKIDEDVIDEAIVEHDGAKMLINDIEAGGPDEEFYDAKVKVLAEQIEHHVDEEEEEEDGMFALARETDVDLEELRDQLMARKQELLQQVRDGSLPPAQLSAVSHPTD
jgi:hypothetical protein